jgi:ribose transport system substrate-binding protein
VPGNGAEFVVTTAWDRYLSGGPLLESREHAMRFLPLLAVCLVSPVAFVCCDPSAGADSTVAGATKTGAGGAARPKVGFITNAVADFWTIAVAGANHAAVEFDVQLKVSQPTSKGRLMQQKNSMEDMVTLGFDGIAISPIDATNQTPLLNKIAKQTTLITHDSDAPSSDRVCFIGVDNYVAGRMCGEIVRDAIPDGGKIMMFIGNLDGDNGPRRRQGVIDELFGRSHDSSRRDPVGVVLVSDDKKWTILGCRTDGFDRTAAKDNAVDALTRHPDIACMVGLFEYNPPLILEALMRAKKLKKVKVVGFDENRTTLQGIRDGTVHGTIAQDPYSYGYQSVRVLAALARGDRSIVPAEKIIDVPAQKVLPGNVDAFEKALDTRLGKTPKSPK